MKLTDWVIIFAAIFICFMLPLDLQSSYQLQAFYEQKEYERMLDRACEDSLMDSVLLEHDDGSITVNQEQVYRRFDELLDLGFDSISQQQKEKMQKSVHMKQFYYLGRQLSAEQTDEIRGQMEQAVAGYGSLDRIKDDAAMFAFYFPYIPKENWYRNIAGPSLYTLFEADSSGDPFKAYRRYVFSGARIVKQVPED